jgi:PAS domain-containing protein
MLNTKKFLTLLKKNEGWEEKPDWLKENIKYSQQLSKTGSWTYDMQTGKVFWTEEIYNLLDCNYNDLNEKLESFLPYVHPADLKKVKKANQDILEGREFDLEYRITTPKGAVKYLHEKTKVLNNENNEPIHSIGIIRDITNHKLIEKKFTRAR